jgi:hypothetical protein
MYTIKHQSTVLLINSLVLLAILILLLIPSIVHADVGVRPILPGGSNIQPEAETPIQMASELVTMNVRPATQADNSSIQLNPEAYGLQIQPVWYPVVAEVQAVFTMTNPTSNDVSLTAWFPLASALETVNWELNPDEIVPRIANFHVAVGGNPIDYSVTELPNPKGADKPLLPWASFPVTFPPGKETNIQVSYLLPLQTSVKGSELALYYIFQTGAGWAGPIGQAELIVNLPYPASPETMARMRPGSLSLPYAMSFPDALIPTGGVMEGNQARFAWTNFEPGPQDDFSMWLIDPIMWQALDTARAAVQANPQDGQAWLDLADIYRSLALKAYNYPGIFSESYLPLGLEAYPKAAELLPEHPAPHAGMAMLSLAPYMTDANAPSEVMGFVQEQLRIARELETAHPDLAEQAFISSWMLEDSINMYFEHITATAISGATSTGWARETETAAYTLTPSDTPTPHPSLTVTTLPSRTPKHLSPTPTLPAAVQPGKGLPPGMILVVEAIIFAIVGFIVYRRLLRKP